MTELKLSPPMAPVVLNGAEMPWASAWEYSSDSVSEIDCDDFIHKIPLEMVGDKDALVFYFDEAWRVLKKTSNPANPAGIMKVRAPCGRSALSLSDPYARRMIMSETFLFFCKEWRDLNKINSNICCDFGVEVNPIIPQELSLLHPEAQARRFTCEWNTVMAWSARLVAKCST